MVDLPKHKIKDEISKIRDKAQIFCEFLQNENITPIQGVSTYEEFLVGLSSVMTLDRTVPYFKAFADYYSLTARQYNIILQLQSR